jgi:hypothetical protein
VAKMKTYNVSLNQIDIIGLLIAAQITFGKEPVGKEGEFLPFFETIEKLTNSCPGNTFVKHWWDENNLKCPRFREHIENSGTSSQKERLKRLAHIWKHQKQ